MFTSSDEIRDLFERFRETKVLIVGDVMIDTYLKGNVERISPEAPVPVVALRDRLEMLGGAANVALNIKSMEATPILCSVIGDDTQGKAFLDLLEKEHISTQGILLASDRITTTKYRIIGNNVQMLRVDHETDENIIPALEIQLLDHIGRMITEHHPSVIILEDYNKGVLTPAVISGICEKAYSAGIPVAVDPKKKNFSAYRNITLFKPNLKEIREGLQIEIDVPSEEVLQVAAKKIQSSQQVDMVMITLSDKGIFICNKETSKILEAHIRPIADVSGAGDTVISITGLCLAHRLSPVQMAALANLAGGQVCEQVGVVPVNRELLLKEAISCLIS
jgi:rfaE bifunctional protein kinase chain/domain